MIATVTLNPSLDEWVDLPALRPGELHRATNFARYPGGKGVNVSRVIHELGGRSVAFAMAGGDDGDVFDRLVRRLGVRLAIVPIPGSTRNNYKLRTARPPAVTEINTAGPPVPARALRALERRLSQRRATCLVLSGSLPPNTPPGVYARWIRRFGRRGTPTVLDTSGRAFRLGLAARPWLVKPNHQEAEEALGRRIAGLSGAARAARALVAAGPRLVILSLGAEGAVLADSRCAWHAWAPRVRVNSAVGAGDSLVGGFLAGWAAGRPLLEAFRLGVAAGTATALTPGTELCHRADVRRLLPRVRMNIIVDTHRFPG